MTPVKPAGIPVQSGSMAPEPKSVEKKFRDVSELYEKQFMREMVKAMRSTVHESGLVKTNQAEKIFREQLDDEYVDKWSAKGGVGFADIIYDQLMQKFGPMLGKGLMQKPHGPIAMDKKSETPVRFELTKSAAQRMDMAIKPKDGKWNQPDVVSPWPGTLLNKIALGDDQQVLEIDHGQGFLGRYVFKGWASDLKPNSAIEAGQILGRVGPDANALYWSLRNQNDLAAGKAQEAGPDTEKTTGE
jgi:flagellar protein FlgJ